MDLSFTPEQEAFRREVRAWIASAMPPHLAKKAADDAAVRAGRDSGSGTGSCYEKGWVAPHWPKEYGGAGLDATRRFILQEELVLRGRARALARSASAWSAR